MTEHPKVRLTDLAANDQWPENEHFDDFYADLASFLGWVVGQYPWFAEEINQLRRAIYGFLLKEAVIDAPENPSTDRRSPVAADAYPRRSTTATPGTDVPGRAEDQSPREHFEDDPAKARETS